MMIAILRRITCALVIGGVLSIGISTNADELEDCLLNLQRDTAKGEYFRGVNSRYARTQSFLVTAELLQEAVDTYSLETAVSQLVDTFDENDSQRGNSDHVASARFGVFLGSINESSELPFRYLQLAVAYASSHQFDLAENALLKARELKEKVATRDDFLQAMIEFSYGRVHYFRGRIGPARESLSNCSYYLERLDLNAAELGVTKLREWISSLIFLQSFKRSYGGKFGSQEQPKFAKALFERYSNSSEIIDENLFEAIGLANCSSYENLAGQFSERNASLLRAMHIANKVVSRFPMCKANRARIGLQMATFLQSDQKPELAGAVLDQAIQDATSLEEHDQVNTILADILIRKGRTQIDRGKISSGRASIDEAIDIYRQVVRRPTMRVSAVRPTLRSINECFVTYSALGDILGASSVLQVFDQLESVISKELADHESTEYLAFQINMASFLATQREYVDAIRVTDSLLKKFEKHESKSASIDPSLVAITHRIASDARRQTGDLEGALKDALASTAKCRTAYGRQRFPTGHPLLIPSLCNESLVYVQSGDTPHALEVSSEAMKMARNLYPKDRFPHGDEVLNNALYNRAFALAESGDWNQAWELLTEAVGNEHAMARAAFAELSETECHNLASRRLRIAMQLIPIWKGAKQPVDDLYSIIWSRRGLIMSAMSQRHKQDSNPKTIEVQAELRKKRSSISNVIRSPEALANNPELTKRLSNLTREKEELERLLVELNPEFGKFLKGKPAPPSQLLAQLGTNDCFVEFVLCKFAEPHERIPRFVYLAFVLQRDQPIKYIELAEAHEIEEAVRELRDRITSNEDSLKAAASLRRLVWAPIEERFVTGVKNVYLCTDGATCLIPWSCLPNSKGDSILLSDYTIRVVPSGQFLLDRLRRPAPPSAYAPRLVLGDVDYGTNASDNPPPNRLARREAKPVFTPLAGTAEEVALLRRLSDEKSLRVLDGSTATVSEVTRLLPTVQLAHFSTHGYVSGSGLCSILEMPRDPMARWKAENATRDNGLTRHPMLLTGLALSGANQSSDDEQNEGILTAEAIAPLPLHQLRLAVLAACDTGLGDIGKGEGVLGLARGFHIAGADNVVANLWKVDDRTEAILMEFFYKGLLRDHLSPAEALRNAQLAIYRNPQLIVDQSAQRGRIDFTTTVPTNGTAPKKSQTTSPRHWAGVIVSGVGN